MEVPQGAFVLDRPDGGGRAPLRAWDAADELVLAHLAPVLGAEGAVPATGPAPGTVVVVGDAWGALACALAGWAPTVVVDSYVGGRAVRANLVANGIDPATVTIVGPLDPLPDRVDVAVLKVPKTGATLDQALHRLAASLHDESVVVGAGMTRHVHTSTIQSFERWVGATTTSRAVKKARLLHATPAGRPAGPTPWPRTATVELPPDGSARLDDLPDGPDEDLGGPLTVTAHAGVFAGPRLDPGTALLLAHLPPTGEAHHAVDLGCGTGIVGTVLARRDPDLAVTFVDDSVLAVASAEATWTAEHGDRPATFVHGDALGDPAPIEADLVVVNPPFHRDHAVGDATAWRMFQQAREALPPGGRLVVVGNRHLAHHAKLARLFGTANVAVLGSDRAYVALAATRP